jgi:hypothetical protein
MMRNRIANFWNVAAQFFLGQHCAGMGDPGFLVASRRPGLGRLRLFDRGQLHCISAACHHVCRGLGLFFCFATCRGVDHAAVGEQLQFTLPACRRVAS